MSVVLVLRRSSESGCVSGHGGSGEAEVLEVSRLCPGTVSGSVHRGGRSLRTLLWWVPNIPVISVMDFLLLMMFENHVFQMLSWISRTESCQWRALMPPGTFSHLILEDTWQYWVDSWIRSVVYINIKLTLDQYSSRLISTGDFTIRSDKHQTVTCTVKTWWKHGTLDLMFVRTQ